MQPIVDPPMVPVRPSEFCRVGDVATWRPIAVSFGALTPAAGGRCTCLPLRSCGDQASGQWPCPHLPRDSDTARLSAPCSGGAARKHQGPSEKSIAQESSVGSLCEPTTVVAECRGG